MERDIVSDSSMITPRTENTVIKFALPHATHTSQNSIRTVSELVLPLLYTGPNYKTAPNQF